MMNPAMQRALQKARREQKQAEINKRLARYYRMNSILGNQWAIFFVIIGARKTGKSYAVADQFCRDEEKLGPENVKTYWLRISDTSAKALLVNKADKLIDPDLKRKYNLDLTTKGNVVYNKGKEFCTVLPLSSFGKMKGVGFYDKDFTGLYNIILDEFQLEVGERRTSFDILYNFIGMVENIARTTKNNIRVYLLGNTLQEASAILKAFDFIPESVGRFYLKRKRAVIDNLPITEEYKKDRAGSIADLLGGDKLSNFTNDLKKDLETVYKGRVWKPTQIIKFTKDEGRWFTVWDGNVIARYSGQTMPEERCICMRPYISGYYDREQREKVMEIYDVRGFRFRDLATQAYFTDELTLIRKQ
ncbi:MAG: phage DNA encapsidation protein [Oscillospiraceae bacterium]|nr:phage DNA encapsidation protein [Oscillospiraceae bacterium]